jgi:hypothetical protein
MRPSSCCPQDPCVRSHKAADDTRTSASTWKGFDDISLFGMTCPHDVCLRLVNIEGTGEGCVVTVRADSAG